MAESKGGCCGGTKPQPQQQQKPLTIASTEQKKKRRVGGPTEGKIVLLGESGVGKSSIAQRFCFDKFDETHDVTIGGAYLQKTVTISARQEDGKFLSESQVKLHIWDTGGSEKFRSMINLYYRDAVGAIICFDLTDERSFESVQYWVNQMLDNTSFNEGGFVMALAGNKCDCPPDQQRIPASLSLEMADKYKMIFKEVSAKTGQGLQELFSELAQKVHKICQD